MRSKATSLIALILIMFLTGCSTTPLPSPTAAPTSTPIPPLPTATINPVIAVVSIDGYQFATIQAAIDDAGTSDGDVIMISEGTHTEAGITVHKNVTIIGQGVDNTIVQAHAVLADAPDRVFLIPEGTEVIIRGLTIRHGHPHDYPQSGGGLANFGDVTLAECVIADNSSNDAGGIFNQGTMAITNCTIADNLADREAPPGYQCGSGGGIMNGGGGTLSLLSSTISGNRALKNGGGVWVSCEGSVMMTNCTLSQNHATRYGGGIGVKGSLLLTNCTVTQNKAVRGGGGVYIQGRLDFVNTIVAGNEGKDCFIGGPGDYRGLGTIGTNSNNLVGDASVPSDQTGDPKLDLLADNGGFTLTHALLSGSSAIDAVALINCTVTTDQRGEPRPVVRESGTTPCDIGAFELQGE